MGMSVVPVFTLFKSSISAKLRKHWLLVRGAYIEISWLHPFRVHLCCGLLFCVALLYGSRIHELFYSECCLWTIRQIIIRHWDTILKLSIGQSFVLRWQTPARLCGFNGCTCDHQTKNHRNIKKWEIRQISLLIGTYRSIFPLLFFESWLAWKDYGRKFLKNALL